jgi:hypothetical protein
MTADAKTLEFLFDLGDTFQRTSTENANLAEFGRKTVFDSAEESQVSRTEGWQQWIAKLAEAGLAGDQHKLELVLLKIIRSVKKEFPSVGNELGSLLAQYSANPNGLRWQKSGPPPTDAEEGLPLLRTELTEGADAPILPKVLEIRIQQFLQERADAERLLVEGFCPPRSVLLTGAPGTGKTMLASWLAHQLRLPLLSLDLATSISSFLGKTGFNIRRVLDYARSTQCVLLLDEFDAIAKRRDDSTEMGELKRIVNVLLKELEDWPVQSVLIAATNHPDLLDPAIRRRFDIGLELPMPGQAEREAILERSAGQFSTELNAKKLKAFSLLLEGMSASEVEGTMRAAVRQHLTSDLPLVKTFVFEFQARVGDAVSGKSFGPLLRQIQGEGDRNFTVRELSDLFGKSVSTIQHHLTREAVDG